MFHEHYKQHSHKRIDESQFILIEKYEKHGQLKEREQDRLKTFYANDLCERKECLYFFFFCLLLILYFVIYLNQIVDYCLEF